MLGVFLSGSCFGLVVLALTHQRSTAVHGMGAVLTVLGLVLFIIIPRFDRVYIDAASKTVSILHLNCYKIGTYTIPFSDIKGTRTEDQASGGSERYVGLY